MQVNVYRHQDQATPQPPARASNILRSEHVFETSEGTYQIIILDADDSIDAVIHYPDGERECVWSYSKDPTP